MVDEKLLYTKEHEWARIEGETAAIGITDHAQEMLGELVFVELPAVGKAVKQKDELAVVESSKAASDVYSPVTGEVTEVNSELESKPELVNDECYGKGWICKLKVTDAAATENLMDAKQYAEYLEGLE
jgi:glycine cleavage system H protein